MKWSDLIDHCLEAHLDDRTPMIDGAPDGAFDETAILRYLTKAERDLARKIWCIHDISTAAVCQITPLNGVANYALHKSVLFVQRVRLSDSELYLRRVGEAEGRAGGPVVDDLPQSAYVAPYLENSARPIWFETQADGRTLHLRPKVDTSQLAVGAKIQLEVFRLPINTSDLAAIDTDTEPEVPEEYHLELCQFASGYALTTHANVDNPSRRFGENLLTHWGNTLNAGERDELRRKVLTAKVRCGGWGNGR